MEMNNLFVVATREKYRFPYKGQIGVEDLWDISLSDLDKVFKSLNREIKTGQEESLLTERNKEDMVLENKIQIIKYIVSCKQTEAAERLLAVEKAEKKRKLMDILDRKREAKMENMTEEEILAELENL